jgi:hypothetical protein
MAMHHVQVLCLANLNKVGRYMSMFALLNQFIYLLMIYSMTWHKVCAMGNFQ